MHKSLVPYAGYDPREGQFPWARFDLPPQQPGALRKWRAPRVTQMRLPKLTSDERKLLAYAKVRAELARLYGVCPLGHSTVARA